VFICGFAVVALWICVAVYSQEVILMPMVKSALFCFVAF
jgi:hypothetical protein